MIYCLDPERMGLGIFIPRKLYLVRVIVVSFRKVWFLSFARSLRDLASPLLRVHSLMLKYRPGRYNEPDHISRFMDILPRFYT